MPTNVTMVLEDLKLVAPIYAKFDCADDKILVLVLSPTYISTLLTTSPNTTYVNSFDLEVTI